MQILLPYAVLQQPAFRQPLEAQGYEVLNSTPDEFEALIRKDGTAMRALVKDAGVKMD